jgi:hypothetical protein
MLSPGAATRPMVVAAASCCATACGPGRSTSCGRFCPGGSRAASPTRQSAGAHTARGSCPTGAATRAGRSPPRRTRAWHRRRSPCTSCARSSSRIGFDCPHQKHHEHTTAA